VLLLTLGKCAQVAYSLRYSLSTRVANYLDITALLCTLSELGNLGFGDMVWKYRYDRHIVYVMSFPRITKSRERDSYIEGMKY